MAERENDRKQKFFAFLSMKDDKIDYHSSEDDDFLDFIPSILEPATEREPGNRIPGYFELVLPRYSDKSFRSHFRVNRSSLELLAQQLSISEPLIQKRQGRKMIDLRKQLCIFLWFSASKEPYRSIAERFDVTESSVHKTVCRVTEAILAEMLRDTIKWPEGERMKEVMAGFEAFKEMKKVVAAIDGCHIPITGRDKDNEVFVNRKQFESVILQGSCDHLKRFTDAFTGFPGSVHDARVFENCDLKQRILNDPLKMVPDGAYLVGDAAYGLETYMMTPYKDNGNFTREQKKYSYYQSVTRNVIEQAFVLLKGRLDK